MFFSGIVLSCTPEALASVGEHIQRLGPAVSVHQTDAATSRLVVVICEDTIEAETERFTALRALNGVLDASLIVHRSEPSQSVPAPAAA